ncbi:hypothetical protein A2U01_0064313, partial [Trifolium medium]|nr:hypothetical protein [Trifolium medium]
APQVGRQTHIAHNDVNVHHVPHTSPSSLYQPSTCTSSSATTSSSGAVCWMKLVSFGGEGDEVVGAIELENSRRFEW